MKSSRKSFRTLQVRRRACSPCRLSPGRNTPDAGRAACRCRPCGEERRAAGGADAPGAQGVEQRQRHRHAGGAEEGPAVKRSSASLSWYGLESMIHAHRRLGCRPTLLIAEELALHDLMDQRPQAIILSRQSWRRSPRPIAVGCPLGRRPWRRSSASWSGPGRARLVPQEELLELVDILEPLGHRPVTSAGRPSCPRDTASGRPSMMTSSPSPVVR